MRSLKAVGILLGVVICITAGIIICLAPIKDVPYTIMVDYKDTETYYEEEPYEIIETYYERTPYQDTETYHETRLLEYRVVETYDRLENGTKPIAYVKVQNIDRVPGIFNVLFLFRVSGMTFSQGGIEIWSKEYQDNKELALEPDETKTAKVEADEIDASKYDWSWNYTITPSTQTLEKQRVVTKYEAVEKQRTVTKYRQAEKQRIVIKQREETGHEGVTLLDYLLHY